MLLKKNYFYLVMITVVSLHAANQTAESAADTVEFTGRMKAPGVDNLTATIAQSADQLNESIKRLIKSVTAWKPSGIGTLALVVGCYSARELFSKYPSKPVAERNRDWVIPTVGLTVSAGTLLYLWSLQQK